jgi:hypothetical protein
LEYTVLITFDEAANPVPLSPDGTKIETSCETAPGDQIRWLSPHGKVAVTFESSPFQDGSLTGDATPRRLAAAGTFPYRCAVVTADGRTHGWPEKSGGGGTVEVGGGTRGGP